MKTMKMSDEELVIAFERAKGRNRPRANKRRGWERDLWTAYLLDGPNRPGAANGPPEDCA